MYLNLCQNKVFRGALNLYNGSGIKIKTVVNKLQDQGNHDITINVSNLNIGIYFYSLNVDGFYDYKKMIIIN